MHRADDIANLFQKLDTSTDAYVEINTEFDFQEPPAPPARPVAVAVKPVIVTCVSPPDSQSPLMAQQASAPALQAPAMPVAAPEPGHASTSAPTPAVSSRHR